MVLPLHRIGAVILACALAASAGCAAIRPAPAGSAGHAGPARAPAWLGGVPLQDGDIILTRFPSAHSALYSLHVPHGRYGHSMMVWTDPGGRASIIQMHVPGIQTRPLDRHLAQYAEAVVVRYRDVDRETQERLGQAARRWAGRARRERFIFALAPANREGGPIELNCVTLISRIYEEAGLPDPFPRAEERTDAAWLEVARRVMGIDLRQVVMPVDVLAQPGFAILATGWNPAIDPRVVVVQDEIADGAREYMVRGWTPRMPRLGERLFIAATLWATPTISRQSRHAHAVYHDFSRRVEAPLADYLRRHPEASEETVRRITRRRGEELRDRYLVEPQAVAP